MRGRERDIYYTRDGGGGGGSELKLSRAGVGGWRSFVREVWAAAELQTDEAGRCDRPSKRERHSRERGVRGSTRWHARWCDGPSSSSAATTHVAAARREADLQHLPEFVTRTSLGSGSCCGAARDQSDGGERAAAAEEQRGRV